ncbi:MAG TPA: PP2C family protein-serine/threonine phosphatase [Cyclobacteriaceae bacterium]|nr:PP2C family protein-serine/threonine phosphatase [Cyclobacteriaceae bacterium]HMV08559.1 PP2C family protein-serine/threonine phosphatase [Cyclobacteriaceae bacterium]HMV90106.1 PP2C family protein-serine/threonine phosphatase [Cyclobacteriaceae bacterium]HMX00232.1 PP2C family protein-serine/threonine phosphatase [Cyclobacteriaceae bacterium]HMX49769.1 PP2C family protein-serine/threonine phosphatase [Cyclobacteriaceae bacterium]
MSELSIKSKFEIKELELNALLEITQAINSNLPEESLYKIYNFTLRSNLNIEKLALFVLDDEWDCKVTFGTKKRFNRADLLPEFKTIQDITHLKNFKECDFTVFDIIIPVAHKDKTLALVFVGGLDKRDTYSHDDGIKFIQALSNIIIVAIENKKLARRQLEQEAFRKELEIASDVQQFLFPEKLPNTDLLKVEASYLPHDHIGGDYYDYIPINKNQFLICVADVSGKGIPAALMMSNFQASLRTLLRQTPNLTDIIEALNFQVLENTKGEKFITFFAAIYDIRLKTMVYVNSGHNPPLLWTKKDGIRLLEEGSTVLGAMHPLPFLNEGFVTGLDDFLLFCYTDGLTETIDADGHEYGVNRVIEYFSQPETYVKDLKTIHQDIIVSLDQFKGRMGYHDDITILSCRVG